MHERDVMDRAGREEWIERHGGNGLTEEEAEALTVFGTPLRQVYIYASARTVFGTSSGSMPGWELDLPIVVVSCIEEIWRRGAFDIELYTSSSPTGNIAHRASILGSTPKFRHLVKKFNSQCTTYSPSSPLSCSHTRYPHLSTSGVPPSTEEIILLLQTYLSSLPESIFSPALVGAAWAWCISPFEGNTEDEGRHVQVARILLRLLPSPNFAMLIYLLAFLRQVMRSANNGTDSAVKDTIRGYEEYHTDEAAARAVGKVFGKSIFSCEDDGKRGEDMMTWFLLRWDQVCHGLFDVGVSSENCEKPRVWLDEGRDPSSKITSDMERNEDLGRPNISCRTTQLTPWMPHDAPGDFFGVSPSMDSSEDLLFSGRGELSAWADNYRSGIVDVHEHESAPLSCAGHHKITDADDKDSIVLMPCHRLFGVDKVTLMRTTPSPGPSFSTDADSTNEELTSKFSGALRTSGDGGSKSICSFASAPALEQRLMDISFPPASEAFLDIHFHGYENLLKSPPQNADSICSSSVPSRASSHSTTSELISSETASTPVSDSVPGSPSAELLELSRAETRVRALKRELERSDTAVAKSIRETFKARERIALLENRVKELELDADSKDALGVSGGEVVRRLEEKLSSVTKERDEALELVKMVKQVMESGRRS
ncbi:hypothetical protein BDZ94DRAFT_1326591 [Collybia nuda]|uniref:Rho-GAP domain-containing protein n=1 Tax=Collybia nuda TaxID=64659 RepID=A0A9P6CDF7_9AGAR|nr:hypothetical protein BDZ94DRAFT_1326591 [Collybia nuda]